MKLRKKNNEEGENETEGRAGENRRGLADVKRIEESQSEGVEERREESAREEARIVALEREHTRSVPPPSRFRSTLPHSFLACLASG